MEIVVKILIEYEVKFGFLISFKCSRKKNFFFMAPKLVLHENADETIGQVKVSF
jgi:hypothetical protein